MSEKCIRCGEQNFVIVSEHRFHTIFRCISCTYLMPIRIEDCCRNPFLNVTIDNKNQERIRLHRQCQNCGGYLDRTRPLSHKQYSSKIRFEFSHINFSSWNNDRNDELRNLWESVKEDNNTSSRFGKYSTYIQSDKWKDIRSDVLERDQNLCQECKTNPAVEVHHKTYENLFNEKMEDLVSLCKDCHSNIHKEWDRIAIENIRSKINS